MAPITREAVSSLHTVTDYNTYVSRILDESRGVVPSVLRLPECLNVPFFNASMDLRRLLVLDRLYQLTDAVDHAITWPDHPSLLHQEELETVLQELTGPSNQKYPVLDLSYASDGFVTLLSGAYGSVHGVVIPLPPDALSNQRQVDPPHAHFQVHDKDMRSIAAEQASIGNNVVRESFKLVIANAILALSQDETPLDDQIHLMYARLLVAFQYIDLGGSLVIALETRPFEWIIDIIATLRQSFCSVAAIQPRKVQAKRFLAYIVCRGYGGSAGVRNLHIHRLGAGIQHLNRGGTARSLPRTSGATDQALLNMQEPFITLFTPVWKLHRELILQHLQAMLQQGHKRVPRRRYGGDIGPPGRRGSGP